MVDLFGVDKGNISLPRRLQSPEVLDGQTDDLKQVMILNMQKAFYQVRIDDITQRIRRLHSRNSEIEESCVAEKLRRSQIDIDTADQIAELNRQIFGEMEKLTDHQKRIETIRKWMEEEKQAHLDKVEAANKKYDETRQAITSEIEVLNAKINTLEEYKTSKTDLRNKLIAGNNLIAQREEEAKQRCEQIQRKFKIGREKLKKEMYARLQGLAGTFQTEVAASMAKPIHRLMRENIFVKNELVDIAKESIPKKEKMKQKKKADDQIMKETVTTKNETVQKLISSKIQGYLLEEVKEQHTRVKDCVEKLRQSDIESEMKSVEVNYSSAKIRADQALRYISRLETTLHRQQTQLGFVNYLNARSKIEVQRCNDVLYDAKYAAACAFGMTDTGKDLFEMEDRQLMFYLLDILCKGDTQRWKNRTPSLATILPPEEAYKIGDLGFDPSHIELNRPRRTTITDKPSKLSTLKILADLGVRLSRINSTGSQIKPWQMDIIDLVQETEDLTDEKLDIQITEGSRLSPNSRGEEEQQDERPVQPEALDEEEEEEDEPETIEEVEAVEKIESEEKLVVQEAPKQDESMIEEIQMDESAAIVAAENNEQSSNENVIQQ